MQAQAPTMGPTMGRAPGFRAPMGIRSAPTFGGQVFQPMQIKRRGTPTSHHVLNNQPRKRPMVGYTQPAVMAQERMRGVSAFVSNRQLYQPNMPAAPMAKTNSEHVAQPLPIPVQNASLPRPGPPMQPMPLPGQPGSTQFVPNLPTFHNSVPGSLSNLIPPPVVQPPSIHTPAPHMPAPASPPVVAPAPPPMPSLPQQPNTETSQTEATGECAPAKSTSATQEHFEPLPEQPIPNIMPQNSDSTEKDKVIDVPHKADAVLPVESISSETPKESDELPMKKVSGEVPKKEKVPTAWPLV
eukprot:TRINITY_DN967_c0_g1_i1.p1 TRINITY_DN967_c0_g1~~TRINITY_DN967_c0_g1_i1.p1  ORF type:complete len:298 (+),score=49.43 TRINITY_DN967_c0_g1_i1:43-936(+)